VCGGFRTPGGRAYARRPETGVCPEPCPAVAAPVSCRQFRIRRWRGCREGRRPQRHGRAGAGSGSTSGTLRGTAFRTPPGPVRRRPGGDGGRPFGRRAAGVRPGRGRGPRSGMAGPGGPAGGPPRAGPAADGGRRTGAGALSAGRCSAGSPRPGGMDEHRPGTEGPGRSTGLRDGRGRERRRGRRGGVGASGVLVHGRERDRTRAPAQRAGTRGRTPAPGPDCPPVPRTTNGDTGTIPASGPGSRRGRPTRRTRPGRSRSGRGRHGSAPPARHRSLRRRPPRPPPVHHARPRRATPPPRTR
jgi:hypothetical protein